MADQLTLRTVEYGCAVAAQGTPDATVTVDAGGVIYDNVPGSVAADSSFDILSGHPADASLPRVDIVGVDSSNTVTQVVGTATAADEFGFVPYPDASSYVQLAAVHVPAGATSVTGDMIEDLRGGAQASQRDFALRHVSNYKVSSTLYGPAATATKWSFAGLVSGNCFAVPYFSATQFDINAFKLQIGTAAGTGAKGRLGAYRDDGAGGLSLIVDAGQVAIDVTGAISATCSATITPGWVWLVLAFQSMSGTPAIYVCLPHINSPIGATSLALLINASYSGGGSYGGMFFTGVTGALPSTLSVSSADLTQGEYPGVWMQAA